MQNTATRQADDLIDTVQIVVKADPPLKFIAQLLQNTDGMFIKISKEITNSNRKTFNKKVNIPFSSAQHLIDALSAMMQADVEGKTHGDTLASETFKNGENIFVVECYIGKSYYLVKIAKNPRTAQRFAGLTMPRDAIPQLIIIINKFVETVESGVRPYEPREEPVRERTTGGRAQNGGDSSRNFSRNMREPFGFSNGGQRRPRAANSNAREKPLIPISEVSPTSFTLDRKEFRVEAVKGNRCFIRITEFISNSKKGTLHIPALHIAEFVSSLNSVNSEIQKVSKDLFQDAPVVQRNEAEAEDSH